MNLPAACPHVAYHCPTTYQEHFLNTCWFCRRVKGEGFMGRIIKISDLTGLCQFCIRKLRK